MLLSTGRPMVTTGATPWPCLCWGPAGAGTLPRHFPCVSLTWCRVLGQVPASHLFFLFLK